jgi:HD superfamily phosphohydrolase
MYWTVYFHKINISAQVILRKVVRRIRDLLEDGKLQNLDPILKSVLKSVDVDKFFLLTDANIIATIYQMADSKDRILSDLCSRFIGRKFFKVIEIEDPQIVVQAKEKLDRLGLNHDYYMATVEPSKVAYSYYSPSGVDVILVNVDGRLEEISNLAPTDALKSLSRKVKKNLLVIPNEVEL